MAILSNLSIFISKYITWKISNHMLSYDELNYISNILPKGKPEHIQMINRLKTNFGIIMLRYAFINKLDEPSKYSIEYCS